MATVRGVIDELAAELGENGQDADVSYVFQNWVVDGVRRVWLAGEWPFAASTYEFPLAIGEDVFSLPSDVGDIKAFQRLDTGAPLTFKRVEELVRAGYDLSDTGDPYWWMYESFTSGAVRLRVYPVPGTEYDYRIYYEKSDPNLTSVDDTIPLPPDFLAVVKDWVRFSYYAQEGDAIAQSFFQLYAAGVDRLRARYAYPRSEIRSSSYNDLDEYGGFPVPQLPGNYPRIF